ncbi:hypothetical protein J7E62_01320 [Variovorax paradoxus]|nr:hypothetical protein [Variovorax paradoxus]
MKPLIEIHRIGTDAYGYHISALGTDAEAQGGSGAFDSLEHCLFDAGASLGHYFARVELNLEGMFLGSCSTDMLRRNPKGVAQRIRQHFQPA